MKKGGLVKEWEDFVKTKCVFSQTDGLFFFFQKQRSGIFSKKEEIRFLSKEWLIKGSVKLQEPRLLHFCAQPQASDTSSLFATSFSGDSGSTLSKKGRVTKKGGR